MWRLIGKPDETKAIAPLIWKRSVAYATCQSSRLEICDVMIWKELTGPQIVDGQGLPGRNHLIAGAREDSLVIAAHTGHVDKYGTRRHILNGFPRDWHSGGQLNRAGWDNAMLLGNVLGMSFQHDAIGGGFQELLYWTNAVTPSVSNLFGVAFRRVTAYSVCEYLDRAPDFEVGLFPDNPL